MSLALGGFKCVRVRQHLRKMLHKGLVSAIALCSFSLVRDCDPNMLRGVLLRTSSEYLRAENTTSKTEYTHRPSPLSPGS